MAIQLDASDAQALTDYGQRVAELKRDIAAAKRAGLNTSALEQNLNRIDAVRKGLLKEFAPTAQPGS